MNAPARTRRMFVRDLILDAQIGVYAHEHGRTQRIRVNLDLTVLDDNTLPVGPDDLRRVVDYERIIVATRAAVATGHTRLVETLAERIAELCLADRRIAAARVTVEKLDVFPDTAAVGVEVERRR
ncbi:MAG: dihydroneopterin aldolase [Acidiphilium sp.]